jgi:hypothetical protein
VDELSIFAFASVLLAHTHTRFFFLPFCIQSCPTYIDSIPHPRVVFTFASSLHCLVPRSCVISTLAVIILCSNALCSCSLSVCCVCLSRIAFNSRCYISICIHRIIGLSLSIASSLLSYSVCCKSIIVYSYITMRSQNVSSTKAPLLLQRKD